MRKIYENPISIDTISMGRVICRIIPEAGINKIPIIASRVGGIPEALVKAE